MLKTAVLFLGIVAAAWSQSTPVSQCLFVNAPLPINTFIEDCPTPPCQLPQLQDVVMHIIFQAPRLTREMRTLAMAYILGPIGLPYDLGEQAVTCNFLTNTYCPVLANEVVMYTLKMYIELFFPVGTSVTIEFRIADEVGPILCIRLPVVIVAPLAGSAVSDSRSNRTMPLTLTIDADGNPSFD